MEEYSVVQVLEVQGALDVLPAAAKVAPVSVTATYNNRLRCCGETARCSVSLESFLTLIFYTASKKITHFVFAYNLAQIITNFDYVLAHIINKCSARLSACVIFQISFLTVIRAHKWPQCVSTLFLCDVFLRTKVTKT